MAIFIKKSKNGCRKSGGKCQRQMEMKKDGNGFRNLKNFIRLATMWYFNLKSKRVC